MVQLDWIEGGQKIVPTMKAQVCPCCDQLVKVYRFPINSSMVKDLMSLASKADVGVYMHKVDFCRSTNQGGHFSKWSDWGLVTQMPNDNPAKKTSGMYALTQKGRDFVDNKLRVPKYILTYNAQVLGFDGDEITIEEALGNHFNYSELMRNV